jgi:LysR family nitrogen assimilation transcriptional regulator
VNLRQLRYFIEVVDTGSFTRAAERLHVAQTALGAQIKQLEDEFNVVLLQRHSRGVQPTSVGQQLYARSVEIISLVDATQKEMTAVRREHAEPVRLGVTPALMLAAGHDLMMNASNLALEVSYVEGMSHVLAPWLDEGQIDFALCYDVPDLPHFVRTPLLQDDLVLATPSDGKNGVDISLAEVVSRPLAMPEDGDSVRSVFFKAARDLGLEPDVQFEVRSVAGMKNMVQKGVASSILPQFSIVDDCAKGWMDCRPIVNPSLRRTLFLTRLKKRRFRREVELIDCVWFSLGPMVAKMGDLVLPLWPSARRS